MDRLINSLQSSFTTLLTFIRQSTSSLLAIVLRNRKHAFWSLSIEYRFENFVTFTKNKQDCKVLTYYWFAGTKMRWFCSFQKASLDFHLTFCTCNLQSMLIRSTAFGRGSRTWTRRRKATWPWKISGRSRSFKTIPWESESCKLSLKMERREGERKKKVDFYIALTIVFKWALIGLF